MIFLYQLFAVLDQRRFDVRKGIIFYIIFSSHLKKSIHSIVVLHDALTDVLNVTFRDVLNDVSLQRRRKFSSPGQKS